MLRNLPNRLLFKDIKLLLKDYLPYINFLYLRMDFKSNCNVGYCFINFINMKKYKQFEREFVGRKVGQKYLKISMGQIQGLRNLIQKFKNSPIMLEKQEFRPMILNNGEIQPFPKPSDGIYRPKVDVLYSRQE